MVVVVVSSNTITHKMTFSLFIIIIIIIYCIQVEHETCGFQFLAFTNWEFFFFIAVILMFSHFILGPMLQLKRIIHTHTYLFMMWYVFTIYFNSDFEVKWTCIISVSLTYILVICELLTLFAISECLCVCVVLFDLVISWSFFFGTAIAQKSPAQSLALHSLSHFDWHRKNSDRFVSWENALNRKAFGSVCGHNCKQNTHTNESTSSSLSQMAQFGLCLNALIWYCIYTQNNLRIDLTLKSWRKNNRADSNGIRRQQTTHTRAQFFLPLNENIPFT